MISKEYHLLNGVEMVTITVAPQFTPEPTVTGPVETVSLPDTKDEHSDNEESA